MAEEGSAILNRAIKPNLKNKRELQKRLSSMSKVSERRVFLESEIGHFSLTKRRVLWVSVFSLGR